MNRKSLPIALSAVVWTMLPLLAAGQTLYRCGNKYQDVPCENGEPTKRISNAPSAKPAQPQVAGAECAARGQDAMTIIWAREAGATQDRQLADVERKGLAPKKAAETRRVIASVYQKTGSAPSIRAEIEAECLAEREKITQAQALAAAAAKLTADIPSDAPPTTPAASGQQTAAPGGANQQAYADDQHKRECARLNKDLASVRSSQRARNSAADMETLNERRRQAEASLRSEGC